MFYPPFLSKFGEVFGLARGADILVYGGMIFLAYMFFDLNNKITKQEYTMTKLITNEAISHISSDHISNQLSKIKEDKNKVSKNDFMFLVKGLNEEKTI